MTLAPKTLRMTAGIVAVTAVVVFAACGQYTEAKWAAVRDSAGNLRVDDDGTFEIRVPSDSVDVPLEEFATGDIEFGPKNGGASPTGSRLVDGDGDGHADDLFLSFDLDDLGFARDGSDFTEQDACLSTVTAATTYRGCQTLTVPPTGYVSPAPPSTGGGGGGGHTPPPAPADGWAMRSTATSPSGRNFYGMAPDATAGVLLYGGYDEMGGSLDDTWRWDGTSWSQLSPSHDPGLRNSHAMAGDGDEVVLFGGYDDSNTMLDDTWEWDGTDWTLVEDGTSGPSARIDAGLAPLGDGRYLLFGGLEHTDVELSDTWVWDGTSWTQLSPVTSPPPRAGHAMALDPQSGDVVIHGGFDWDPSTGSSTFLDDTWSYDVATNTWSPVSVGTSAGPRSHAGMGPSAPDGPLVLFGGYSWGGYVGSTYVLDGGTWVERIASPAPGARSGHDVVLFEGSDSYALLFGGSTHGGVVDDTWVYSDG